MPVIDGFAHRPGDHCGSTSLRNLATYYGWDRSESTCFGLAAGLGFTFFERSASPPRAFFGRPLWLETAFFDHLGIDVDHRSGQSWTELWRRTREGIDDGDPVMLFTDIYHLDYYGTDTHFAPHSLLAVGYDAETDGNVLVSDSEFPDRQRVPVDRLRAAVGSEHVSPAPNRSLSVTDPEPGVSLSTAARRALTETAEYMLDPTTASHDNGPGTHGLAGVRAFADELPEWPDLPEPTWTVRFAYQNVERRGTGGGCFRRLYAAFLSTVVEEGWAQVPADAPDRMVDIADDWTAIGEQLRAASDRDVDAMGPPLREAATAVHDVADREQRLFEDLLAALS